MSKSFLPAEPHKGIVRTTTPVRGPAGDAALNNWFQDRDGEWQYMANPQEKIEMARTVVDEALDNHEPRIESKANTQTGKATPAATSQPKTYYVSSADFKYPSWRRIEDKRTIYSMSGVKLSEANKYQIELTKPVIERKDQIAALQELVDATIEYGYLAPEPCTERWVNSDDEYIINLQSLRIDLHNLFLEHHLLDHKEYRERKLIWDYLNVSSTNVQQTLGLIEELVKDYKYGMFDPETKYRYGTRYVSKKQRKKALTRINNAVKNKVKVEENNAVLH